MGEKKDKLFIPKNIRIDGLRPLPDISQWDDDPILYEAKFLDSGDAVDFWGPHWVVQRDDEVYIRWQEHQQDDAELCALMWNEPRQYDWYEAENTPFQGLRMIVDIDLRIDLIVERIRSQNTNDQILRHLLNGLDSWFLPMRRAKSRGATIDVFDESTFTWEDGCWWEPCVEDRIEKGWFDHSAGVFREFVGPQRRPLSKDNADDLREVFNSGMEYTEMDTCTYISCFARDLGYTNEDCYSFTDTDNTWKSAMWYVHGSLDWTNAPKMLAAIKKSDDDYQAMLVRNDLLESDGYCNWEKKKELEEKGELI
jgi:hypothetical protein